MSSGINNEGCNFIQQRLQADDFQIPPHRLVRCEKEIFPTDFDVTKIAAIGQRLRSTGNSLLVLPGQ